MATPRTVSSVPELISLVGQDLGTSPWFRVTQDVINDFAEVTGDHESIHVDVENASSNPFGSTIAHGLLTLSLGPRFLAGAYTMSGHRLVLNYGYDKIRFLRPVLVDSNLRMTVHLKSAEPIRDGGTKFHIQETFEVEGSDGPACVADFVVAYFE